MARGSRSLGSDRAVLCTLQHRSGRQYDKLPLVVHPGSPVRRSRYSTHGTSRNMKTAKVFKHGNSQAVRLPKEFRFTGKEVQIKRVGAGVLLSPTRLTYEQIMTVVHRFKGPVDRQQPF